MAGEMETGGCVCPDEASGAAVGCCAQAAQANKTMPTTGIMDLNNNDLRIFKTSGNPAGSATHASR